MSFLSIQDLTVRLRGNVPILRRVSLDVAAGESRALVGESGAGKSMIGKSVLGTLPQALGITGGQIFLEGEDLGQLSPRARRQRIGAKVALIPQDPLTALNPSRRVGPQITNRLVDILGWSRKAAEARALELLEEVHIPDPARVMRAYPHELSGGMRQRILIASAFAAEPKLIIADEPTTALDVTVQKQILRLISDMQQRHGTALLFVTHDLGVVSKVCQTMTVLYSGKVVEDTKVRDFFASPGHPYSAALLAATPKYTDPDGSLTPVPDAVIRAVEEEVAAFDRQMEGSA
ncbi:ABC transporter ATP-binding protein [Phaeobacter gallaeciensis]|uniref:ABC transporter ATP-binding protein n=1 Tax=Phaeobacter gallaeciensis TaxID=60890 RepID=UPI00237F5336|nr:ABC transporter ATP-binding protein [Phaeobacter gallaeciensis]MDE4304887.1 ABC transporter ATP-binding protein [Phaeobacter gallaeciensis]MDE4309235.1 ABC transporter ATP-binding protein [Phaeobacter gallaeciensis]MDE4313692.1 ABC transporter ATP-binding protein [Phaeobacter gallaeciensis]MDE4318330.1 ABC transporter ATP-binding protein [Phaeobacter gallaeciensis]MDE4323178.1 ABC transporter ATP-binding protein [Phaeobacter gallaeciensis]